MTMMRARVTIHVTVDFEDDGKTSMSHQAEQAAMFELGLPTDPNAKVGDATILAYSAVSDANGVARKVPMPRKRTTKKMEHAAA